jgi:hypothetical protein
MTAPEIPTRLYALAYVFGKFWCSSDVRTSMYEHRLCRWMSFHFLLWRAICSQEHDHCRRDDHDDRGFASRTVYNLGPTAARTNRHRLGKVNQVSPDSRGSSLCFIVSEFWSFHPKLTNTLLLQDTFYSAGV